MRVGSTVLALILGATLGCQWTRVVATDIELSDEGLALERETPWRFDYSSLELCVEPSGELSLDPTKPAFTGFIADGEAVEISLTLTSPEGHSFSLHPSRFSRNLTCFNLADHIDPSHGRLALQSAPPIQVERVYWFWYFYK